MSRSTLRIARDYNRTLAPPVRWVHIGLAAFDAGAFWRRITGPSRLWAVPLLIGALAFCVVFPFDAQISRLAGRIRPTGDLARELEALQQFGALGSLIIAASVIWLLNVPRRRRILDLIAASGLTGLCVITAKVLAGRPRPRIALDDPHYFAGPFGAYPLGAERGVRHSWEVWARISSDLWSMPSSHTAYAVALAVFLGWVYPRLRPLVFGLAALVGACRILFGAHYPTDVIAGAALGFIVAAPAVRGHWGVRALDWIWIRFVDKDATPAYRRTDIAPQRDALLA